LTAQDVGKMFILLATQRLVVITEMIFYNGFNLLVDLILVFVVYVVAHGIGFRRGLNKNKPPF
jgi:hypothetical protein